jgi:glutaredoxin 3
LPRDACPAATPAASQALEGDMKDTNVVLYQAEWCPYCAKVRSKMTDLLLDYKNVNVPHDHAARTVLKEISGQTGIPTLVDGDVVIADDDDAIIAYLEKTYAK